MERIKKLDQGFDLEFPDFGGDRYTDLDFGRVYRYRCDGEHGIEVAAPHSLPTDDLAWYAGHAAAQVIRTYMQGELPERLPDGGLERVLIDPYAY